MKSRLYTGLLRHRRHSPTAHSFNYRVFMPYLCLSELPTLFDDQPLWSARRAAPARFRRSDFLGDAQTPLDEAVREHVQQHTGERPGGDIYLLANMRYFGYLINPLSCYYCFNADNSQLQYVVAAVTNTPWGEKHAYVLDARQSDGHLNTVFDKAMHVSPFNPMDMRYHWRSNTPGRRLAIHLENHREGERLFDATLALSARALNRRSLQATLWQFPLMTAKVAGAIYWQALKLYLKGAPVHAHPRSLSPGAQQ
jgi:DUF1365 family protein